MPEVITFNGSTIWSTASGGVSWTWDPGHLHREVVETPAPLGEGVWVKCAGTRPATHTLKVVYCTSTPRTTQNTLVALEASPLGPLVMPSPWGTYNNCRIDEVEVDNVFRTDDASGAYIIELTLTIKEYP